MFVLILLSFLFMTLSSTLLDLITIPSLTSPFHISSVLSEICPFSILDSVRVFTLAGVKFVLSRLSVFRVFGNCSAPILRNLSEKIAGRCGPVVRGFLFGLRFSRRILSPARLFLRPYIKLSRHSFKETLVEGAFNSFNCI